MRSRVVVAAVVAASLVASCGGGGSGQRRRVTESAAASLNNVYRSLEKRFAADSDPYTLTFSFAGSQQLVAQIEQGANADVIATADRATMAKVEPKTLHRAPTLFARNRLVIAVRPGNPSGVHSLADLARPGLKVVLAAPTVPRGRYPRDAVSKAGGRGDPVAREGSLERVSTKVALGEADAGIVFATGALARPQGIEAVAIPSRDNVE